MNELLSIFLTWQFLLLCIGFAALTFLVRVVIEFSVLNNPKLPGNSQSKVWREGFLVLFPVILGFVFPWVGKSFSYPIVLVDPYSKFMFSASAGLLSPIAYRVIKAALWKTVDSGQSSDPTPPPFAGIINNIQTSTAPPPPVADPASSSVPPKV